MTKKVPELAEQPSTAKDLTFRKPFYYAADDEAACCPRCWEAERIRVHLRGPDRSPRGVIYSCTNCGAKYWTEILHSGVEPAEPHVEPHDLQRELMERDPEP